MAHRDLHCTYTFTWLTCDKLHWEISEDFQTEKYIMKTPLIFPLVQDAPSAALLNKHTSKGSSTAKALRCASALQLQRSAEMPKLASKWARSNAGHSQTAGLPRSGVSPLLLSRPPQLNRSQYLSQLRYFHNTPQTEARTYPLKWRTSQG